MPWDRTKYPDDWESRSDRIRFDRAGGRCECEGECGLHRTHPGPRRCTERHGQPADWANGLIVLTVAHLDHDTTHNDDNNLKAMCQRCHLRYDQLYHQQNSYRRRRAGKAIGDLFE